jgi:hypothetical protein
VSLADQLLRLAEKYEDLAFKQANTMPKPDEYIRAVQKMINSSDGLVGVHLQEDGILGPLTTEAIREWQAQIKNKKGLIVDPFMEPTGKIDNYTAELMEPLLQKYMA